MPRRFPPFDAAPAILVVLVVRVMSHGTGGARQQTGGRAFFINSEKQLPEVYGQIRDELASQYSLAYESKATRDGRWRTLQVRVSRPNATVRTRAGYFAGK